MTTKWVVTLVATLLILGSMLLWQQSQMNAMANTVSTNYASRLQNIGESMNEMADAIDGALLVATPELASDDLATIWRMADKIRYEMSTLPIDAASSTRWLNYLARIGDSAKLVENGELDFAEWQQTMKVTEKNLEVVVAEWDRTNGSIEKKEQLLNRFYHNKLDDTSKADMEKLDKLVQTYTENDFPVTTSESDHAKKKELAALKGDTFDKKSVLEKWKKDFPELANLTVRITESKKNAPYPFYHIEFSGRDVQGFADYSVKGGYLLTTLLEKPYSEKSLDPKELKQSAQQKIEQLGFTDTELTASRENHTAWHFTFTRKMPNQAFVYSDSIQIKVAKDSGDILGIQPMEYLQEEKLPDTKPVELEASEVVSEGVEVLESNLAYLETKSYQQQLCYELKVQTAQGENYTLFVDAVTHEFVKKEKNNG